MKRLLSGAIVLCAFAFLSPVLALAQHFPPAEDLTQLIRSRVDERGVTGIVLGVLEADGTTQIVSYGSPGPNARALSRKSLFEIGSITKVFTGILLADMAARGEVSLADPVSKHLPDSVRLPSRGGQEITLVDLSTHFSSLPRLPGNMRPADFLNPYADYTVEQMYNFLAGHELRRDIGSVYEYSNLAVGLLGHVLARVGGGSYEHVVRERILDPVGMSMTGITLEGDMVEWMTKGHNQNGNVVPLWDLPTLAGAGALRSNAEDMLEFLAANTGIPETRLQQSMRESHEAQRSVNVQMSIGLGWHIRRVGEEKIIWHGGGTGGFRTFIGFDPSSGVGAVVLTNSGISADDIGFHLINPDLPLTAERAEVEVAPDILASYVGEYRLTPVFSIVVTLVGDALFLQATGQPRLRMYAASETDFFLRVVDAQISFTTSESGQVSEMVLHQNGVDQTGVRIR